MSVRIFDWFTGMSPVLIPVPGTQQVHNKYIQDEKNNELDGEGGVQL